MYSMLLWWWCPLPLPAPTPIFRRPFCVKDLDRVLDIDRVRLFPNDCVACRCHALRSNSSCSPSRRTLEEGNDKRTNKKNGEAVTYWSNDGAGKGSARSSCDQLVSLDVPAIFVVVAPPTTATPLFDANKSSYISLSFP